MKNDSNGDRLHVSTGGHHVPGKAFNQDKAKLIHIIKSPDSDEHKVADLDGVNSVDASFATMNAIDKICE